MSARTDGLAIAAGVLFAAMLATGLTGLVVQFGFLAGVAALLVVLVVSLVAAFLFEGVLLVFLGLVASGLHAVEVAVDWVRPD